MKVFVATRATQGVRDSDFSWTVDGELVRFGFACDRDHDDVDGPCGCRRAMAGMASSKSTTTFTVVDRDIDFDDYAAAVFDAYTRDGWNVTVDAAAAAAVELADLARAYDSGVTLERRGGDAIIPRWVVR